MKKRVKISIIIAAVIIAAGVFIYIQRHSLRITGMSLSYREVTDSVSNHQALLNIYRGEDIYNDIQVIRGYDRPLSNSDRDYCKCVVHLSAKNVGLFKIKNIQAYVEGEDEDSIIIGNDTYEPEGYIKRLSENDDILILRLFIYKDGLSEQEICEYVKNLTVTIYYETDLMGVVKKQVELKDYLE